MIKQICIFLLIIISQIHTASAEECYVKSGDKIIDCSTLSKKPPTPISDNIHKPLNSIAKPLGQYVQGEITNYLNKTITHKIPDYPNNPPKNCFIREGNSFKDCSN